MVQVLLQVGFFLSNQHCGCAVRSMMSEHQGRLITFTFLMKNGCSIIPLMVDYLFCSVFSPDQKDQSPTTRTHLP